MSRGCGNRRPAGLPPAPRGVNLSRERESLCWIQANLRQSPGGTMTRILVLYHSMYGHVETMDQAVAEGARKVTDTDVAIKRVPETMDPAVFKAAGGKFDQPAPLASPGELPDYDAILFGTPTRFGNMSGQMRTFLDQTGALWVKKALLGKLVSPFTSIGTVCGDETSICSTCITLAHHGMIIVPSGYGVEELNDISQVGGGTPYGASTIAAPDGSRQPDPRELHIARYQGEWVAQLARRMQS